MEDFTGLASSLATGVSDVRGCLLLSRDGLVLGSHPQDAEARTKPAWIRFAALGDPERGFTQFGTETWCYVRRGPYAAFAVVGPGERPGLVIDHMEQILLAAEETRNSREGVREEAPVPAQALPTSRPRTPLHPEPRPLEEPLVIAADATGPPVAAPASRSVPAFHRCPLPPLANRPRGRCSNRTSLVPTRRRPSQIERASSGTNGGTRRATWIGSPWPESSADCFRSPKTVPMDSRPGTEGRSSPW